MLRQRLIIILLLPTLMTTHSNSHHSNTMEKKVCLFCHDEVRVPVFYKTDFLPCPQPRGRPGCHSINRVCVLCAREHVGLNKPYRQRKEKIKCLLCPTVGYPRKLRGAHEAYEKDFSYMSMDKTVDYPCFHSGSGCGFKGTQNGLDHHIQYECLYRMTTCTCGTQYRVIDEKEHIKTCVLYWECPVCSSAVYKDDVNTHLSTVHTVVSCRHVGCDKLIATSALESHMAKECPYRSVHCNLCGELKRVCDYKDHLSLHIHQHQQTMVQLVSQMNETHKTLTDSIDAYQKWVLSLDSLVVTED